MGKLTKPAIVKMLRLPARATAPHDAFMENFATVFAVIDTCGIWSEKLMRSWQAERRQDSPASLVQKVSETSVPARRTGTMERGSPRLQSLLVYWTPRWITA
jgi:hypothetical protein